MLKNILISALAVILLLAVGFSAYNVFAGGRAEPAQALSSQPVSGQQAAPQPAYTPQYGTGQPGNQGQYPAQGQDTWQGSAQGKGGGQGGQGFGRQGGQGQSRGQNGGQGGGQANPQNGFSGYTTNQGTVSNYAPPVFTLVTADGQNLTVQLGNQNFFASQGLVLQNGDQVTITGFQDASGSIAIGTLTLDATGQTFTLRTETGRPAWAGGGGRN